MITRPNQVLILTASIALLVATGCGGKGASAKSDKAVASLAQTRADLEQAKTQIDKTLGSLSSVQNQQPDLRIAVANYQKEIKNTEKLAAKIRRQVSDMQARASAYQQKWQKEISEMTNPDLRASAQERAAKVRSRYDEITQKGRDVRAAYDPYIHDLKDFERYLTADMTPAALAAAAPVIEKSTADGARLKSSIDTFIAELDSVGATMSPTETLPAKK
jgi:chromosome segregation ATPase